MAVHVQANETVTVIKCGTHVITKIGKIKAIITAACIRFEKTQYELSYFSGGERQEAWCDEREFDVVNESRQVIGFRHDLFLI